MTTQALALVELLNHDLYRSQSKSERAVIDAMKASARTHENAMKLNKTSESKRRLPIPGLIIATWLRGFFPNRDRATPNHG
jgi:hypothetical protein|tara:strand:+ start:2304 stop:2546 length:243 start_codon:yes stop_codon:yes gene_type:complete